MSASCLLGNDPGSLQCGVFEVGLVNKDPGTLLDFNFCLCMFVYMFLLYITLKIILSHLAELVMRESLNDDCH